MLLSKGGILQYAGTTSAVAGKPALAENEALKGVLEPLVKGLGLELIELNVFRQKGRTSASRKAKGSEQPKQPKPGSVQVRVVVYKPGAIGLEECSRVHHAILPRLELALPGDDLYVEVSSPGIDRLIKCGQEFEHYAGRGVRCYRTDISDWSRGILENADEKGIVLRGETETMTLAYEIIAKAKLDPSQEV